MTELGQSSAVSRSIAGRYTLREELGRGGMGVVWRGEDAVIGRQVAVKELLPPPGLAEPERAALTERVLAEARAAGTLNHPAVVTIHDVVVEDGVPFIVMELIEAPTLHDLAAAGPLPAQRVAEIGKQVVGALAAAHAAGIVHRDIKPANILVDADGRVKLTDFGIARADGDQRVTATGAVVGSPAYLAPERIQGQAATPATDLWSLGVTLLAASEGGEPFHRENTAATLYAVLNEPAPLHRTHGLLAEVIGGLLAKTPHERLTADRAGALLAHAASPAGATTVVAGPTVTTPAPPPQAWWPGPAPVQRAQPNSTAAILVGVASVVFGVYLLADALLMHQLYLLAELSFSPELLLGRLSIVFGGLAALVGGSLLLARVRAGLGVVTASAGLTLLFVCLLTLSAEEQRDLGYPTQPGLTLDLLALAFAIALVAVVWLPPVRRSLR
ncbi:serine/threonine-protein kinase [Amycolatopsis samaneae]|uniref:non-specific serine/threonine protein kinase n=1 Tax=Amycolatopsis samaneae TaxID=664691 RepID=A0ABW5GDK8_9PSEU